MELQQFLEQVDILALAFPRAFPADDDGRGAAAVLWYDHFKQVPLETFIKASKRAREREQFLSIATMWEAVVAVVDVPTPYQAREDWVNHLHKPESANLLVAGGQNLLPSGTEEQ